MTRRYAPRLPNAVWREARRFWEETRRCSAADVADRFGTTLAAVKHRITREQWTRGFTYRVTPVDHLCPTCAGRADRRSLLIRLDTPIGEP